MGVQVKLLVLSFFLVLSALSFCEATKATVKVVGILHSKDSIKNHSTNTNSSLGIDVFINCNEKTKGKGGIDEHGKFNVTLSAKIGEDTSEIDGCYARLQSNSGAPCHIQEPQTASVKFLAAGEKEAVISDKPAVIKFSPLDCQSAFFWPFPNLTFLGSPPSPPEYTAPPSPPEYTAPPAPAALPPAASPAQPPPQPSYDPPVPSPSRPPSAGTPPAPAPTCQDPIESPSPPPAYTDPATPAAKSPALAPPPAYTDPATPATKTPSPPPLPVYKNPSPPPSTAYNKPSPSPPALPPLDPTPAMSSNPPPSATIPSRRRPSPIPRAPPIPRLPVTPSVPRKYFNPPNSSKSKPPRLV